MVLRALEILVYLPLLAFAIVAHLVGGWIVDAVGGAVVAAYVVARRTSAE